MLGGRPKGSRGGPDPARWAPRHSKTPAATARAPVAASSRRGVKAFTRGRVSSGKWHGEAIRIGKWVANRGEEVARGGLGVSPVPSCPAGGPPAPALGGASPCTTRLRARAQRRPKQGKGGEHPKGHPTSAVGRIPKHNLTPNLSAPPHEDTQGTRQHLFCRGRGRTAPRQGDPRPTWDQTGDTGLLLALFVCGSAGVGAARTPPRGVTSVPGGVLFPAPVSAAETR